jgi:uncharacterized membrane protein
MSIQTSRTIVWFFILFFTLALIPYTFYTATASRYEYTYELPPASPGSLRTTRWSADFFFVGSLVLLWPVPLTLAFMVDDPLSSGRLVFHVILLVMLSLYYLVVMAFWAFDYAKANEQSSGNAGNPANDPRWCCVNYALSPASTTAGAVCLNTVACPGLSQADLHVDELFLFKFWYLVAFLVMFGIDFVIVLANFRYAAASAAASGEEVIESKIGAQVSAIRQTPMRTPLLQYKARK